MINQAKEIQVQDEIFPKNGNKTYTLVEVARGESTMVGKGPEDTLFSFPIVLLWEILLTLGVSLGVFVFSLLKQAPLEELANPMVTTDPAKAPWYFVGLQELLEHMHPTAAGVLIPTLLVLFLMAIPYIDQSRESVGRWFSSPRGLRITAATGIYSLATMVAYILLDNTFNLRELLRGSTPQWVSQGLLPLALLLILVAIPAIVLWQRKASTHEVIMALFTVMVVSAFVFTLSGFLFRGPGFKLYWPWDMPDGYNPWNDL